MDDQLHATIEEFAAEGYTHVECFCPRCRVTQVRTMSWLPKISMGLTLAQPSVAFDALSAAGRCAQSSRGDRLTCLASLKGWRG
jgi:hypothetical protein